MINIIKASLHDATRPKGLIWFLVIAFLLSALYPSDIKSYTDNPMRAKAGVVVHAVENYGRFVNTALQVVLPFAMRDPVGVTQLAFVAVAGTLATHGTKHLVNDWQINGTRLGQRPSGESSKHNIPSGHSSMASSATYFVCRRYSLKFAWLMIPILLLTMYARVALDDHTISGVLSGCILGFLMAAIFTSRYRRPARPDSLLTH